ncbi:PorH family porin [Corynebacterium pacaense]|uniref:PorH family porin n=1 Tax=Corynebacterium pacaense TaxID=1816684 RepID=UPI0015C4657F|nr:PorH family porin [Corynebacterium pacaense]
MDLSLIQSTLADFATFGTNIGKALGGIPKLLLEIVSFVKDAKGDVALTSSNLGSSK